MVSGWCVLTGGLDLLQPSARPPTTVKARAPPCPCVRVSSRVHAGYCSRACCVRSCLAGTHLRREVRVHGASRGSSGSISRYLVHQSGVALALLPGSPWCGCGAALPLFAGGCLASFDRLASFALVRYLVAGRTWLASLGFRLRRVGPPFPTPSSTQPGPAAFASLMLVRQFFRV